MRLVTSGASGADIGLALGYESDAAFSTAFKRVMGRSPRQYSRGHAPAPPSALEEASALPSPF